MFASCLPVLLEEGLASFKGNKPAKQLLDPSLTKKVSKQNAIGFLSYAAVATLSAIGICAGRAIKDKITASEKN